MERKNIQYYKTLKFKRALFVLVLLIVLLGFLASYTGIFSSDGPGPYTYQSIRGKPVTIHGYGLYKDMSAEVAPQGIAQDYISLFLAIPLLILAFTLSGKGSLVAKYMLAGTLAYFLVTYGFYTVMAMYNKLYIVYVALMGLSFYGFLLAIFSFDVDMLKDAFKSTTPVKWAGSFLVFIAIFIACLWLNIILPPLCIGTIVPVEVEHYTTLIVQAFDLGILLPASILSGLLFMKKKAVGYLLAPVYLVFLSLLMTALSAKVFSMWQIGFEVMPVIIIIPFFNLLTIIFTIIVLASIKEKA